MSAGAGSQLSVLGPNGAGKTTAVRIQSDGGRAVVEGHDVVRATVAPAD